MKKHVKTTVIVLALLALIVGGAIYLMGLDIAILNPKGEIAHKEKNLLITASLLMLIVVVPVFILTALFVWKYRASNKNATYTPDWEHSTLAESIWWGVPLVIIAILAVITWKTSHELNPFKPLESDKKPLTIQVVALQWKWLFIYPEEEIATVNFVQFPEKRPIRFEITADAPMNSFWIPQLGGQIYAMPAMKTQLHLIANEVGEFQGCSANISGKGFAGMTFIAKASTEDEFYAWVQSCRRSSNYLTQSTYDELVKPSQNVAPKVYALEKEGLFDQIVMKYSMPSN